MRRRDERNGRRGMNEGVFEGREEGKWGCVMVGSGEGWGDWRGHKGEVWGKGRRKAKGNYQGKWIGTRDGTKESDGGMTRRMRENGGIRGRDEGKRGY
jgi:hypothetical protein